MQKKADLRASEASGFKTDGKRRAEDMRTVDEENTALMSALDLTNSNLKNTSERMVLIRFDSANGETASNPHENSYMIGLNLTDAAKSVNSILPNRRVSIRDQS